MTASAVKKTILCVIDGLSRSVLDRAVAQNCVPTIAATISSGYYFPENVAAFPSVTPVCAASIVTGQLQDKHWIPSMNWYSREERRYVEYGSSFAAARKLGIPRQLVDTIYRLNAQHLNPATKTLFEFFDDEHLRTACTTYLVYRGRYQHALSRHLALTRIMGSMIRGSVAGPREFFYADLFATRPSACRAQFGLPGYRDRHSGCVGAELVEQDRFDFLLLSLPDVDTAGHKGGYPAQQDALIIADQQIEKLVAAAGGLEDFFTRYRLLIVSDHGHAPVDKTHDLFDSFPDWQLRLPKQSGEQEAQLAICPAQRSGMIYALGAEEHRHTLIRNVISEAVTFPGIDLAVRQDDGWVVVHASSGERLYFRPSDRGSWSDVLGRRWEVKGSLEALAFDTDGTTLVSERYPAALERLWAAMNCRTSGDVLLSAADGYEFNDWGGAHHSGAGSHGSLARDDSLGILIASDFPPPPKRLDGTCSICDTATLIAPSLVR